MAKCKTEGCNNTVDREGDMCKECEEKEKKKIKKNNEQRSNMLQRTIDELKVVNNITTVNNEKRDDQDQYCSK